MKRQGSAAPLKPLAKGGAFGILLLVCGGFQGAEFVGLAYLPQQTPPA